MGRLEAIAERLAMPQWTATDALAAADLRYLLDLVEKQDAAIVAAAEREEDLLDRLREFASQLDGR